MKKSKFIPELLAPAGTIEAGLAAFDVGADAVYAGLEKFNAREGGQNFTLKELSKLIAYAHKINRRVYVTLNTLIKERELPDVVDTLADLALIGPDALIVQDIGLTHIIREYFSELEIHGSTQMAIHNSLGLKIAEKMGMSRVILERQVSFEEIAEIRKKTSIELEVFVHGALCCSRSGVCLFSSWMGGWSGNRGKCKQPCRRRYFSHKGNGFFFSPGDLYSLEELWRLKKIGIESFKIEGRLRRPDYVKKVVAAYRMVLDAPSEKERDPKFLKEARGLLSGALGRKWHQPFKSEQDFKDIIRHQTIGASGLLCGTVLRSSPKGFEIEVTKPLHLYDKIRVQPRSGDEGPQITLKKLFLEGKNISSAKKGSRCWVESDVPVEGGSYIFKTGSSTDSLTSRVQSLPEARPTLDLKIHINDQKITIETLDNLPDWTENIEVVPARKQPIDSHIIVEQFRKSRSEKFAARHIAVSLPENVFIAAPTLKQVRRQFWQWADSHITEEMVWEKWITRKNTWIQKKKTQKPVIEKYSHKKKKSKEIVVRLAPKSKNPVKNSLVATLLHSVSKKTEEVVLPDFYSELEIKKLSKRIEDIIESGLRRFRVTSLHGLELLGKYEGLHITMSFPFPVCNSAAVEELQRFGVQKVTAWVELEKRAIDELIDRCGDIIEVFVFGRLPILSTRMNIPLSGQIKDGRGNRFLIKKEGVLTFLYPENTFSISVTRDVPKYIDLTHTNTNENLVSEFNYNRDFI